MADAKVDRLVLASSMVVYGDGRYRCDRHGSQRSSPRSLADLDAGRFEVACPVCGEPMRWQLVDEDAALLPLSAYAASKVAQEHYATAWTRQLPGRAVSLRYHNVYGPGVPADSPYSGVAAIFRSAIARGESPRVFEDGLQMRDFVHVDDVARANLLAIDAVGSLEPGGHRPLNVCSGQPLAILDVARILVGESHPGLEPAVTGDFRPGDVRHIVADPARARAELGFTARIRPDDGLRAFASDPLRATHRGPLTSP
jgi:dTDP-L-rhamnose 4-epimerase